MVPKLLRLLLPAQHKMKMARTKKTPQSIVKKQRPQPSLKHQPRGPSRSQATKRIPPGFRSGCEYTPRPRPPLRPNQLVLARALRHILALQPAKSSFDKVHFARLVKAILDKIEHPVIRSMGKDALEALAESSEIVLRYSGCVWYIDGYNTILTVCLHRVPSIGLPCWESHDPG